MVGTRCGHPSSISRTVRDLGGAVCPPSETPGRRALAAGRPAYRPATTRLKDFAGQRVAIVGGGISAVQQLEEISRVATTFWYTRREPVFRNTEFNQDCCAQAPQATDPLVGSSPQLPTPPRGRPVENK